MVNTISSFCLRNVRYFGLFWGDTINIVCIFARDNLRTYFKDFNVLKVPKVPNVFNDINAVKAIKEDEQSALPRTLISATAHRP